MKTNATPPRFTLPENPAADRDATGRFQPGNKVGRGNPFNRRVARLRSALLESATPEKIRNVANKLYRQAIAGDVAAAKLYLAYTIGKPTEAVDPDRTDLHEWKLLNEGPTLAQAMRAMLDALPPAAVVELAQGILPADADAVSKKLRTTLVRDEEAAQTEGPAPRTLSMVQAERKARIGK